jgi:DNA repair and recombination protein RAD54 and RAD54-like protein
MQNDLSEFYAMASFCNPSTFGTPSEFRKYYENPILAGREPGASNLDVSRTEERTEELSRIVNHFVLRRTNTLLSKHLPPKVMQVVCCKMTDMQRKLYQHLLTSKGVKMALTGRKTDVLPLITALKKLCNHPRLVYDSMKTSKNPAAIGLDGCEHFFPPGFDRMSKVGCQPELSGKMLLLAKMLAMMRAQTKVPLFLP